MKPHLGQQVNVTVRIISTLGIYAEKTMKLEIDGIMETIEKTPSKNKNNQNQIQIHNMRKTLLVRNRPRRK